MLKMRRLLFVASSLIFLIDAAVDFSCPDTISDLRSGTFPDGAKAATQFPANYHCEFSFYIPDGYIVVFETHALIVEWNGVSGEFSIFDTLNKKYSITGTETVYAPANSARVFVTTGSPSASSFIVKWSFKHVGGDKPAPKPMIDYYALDLPSNSPWLMGIGSIVLVTTGRPSDQILVYDGRDLNARYIGMLSSFQGKQLRSSGDGMTLVNYGPSIKNSGIYALATFTDNVDAFSSWEFVGSVPSSYHFSENTAVSFICPSKRCYLEQISIAESHGVVGISQLPGQMGNLFYEGADDLNNQMPQELLADLITVEVFNSSASMTFADSSGFSKWQTLFPGRRGTILSPSTWYSVSKPSYETNFQSVNSLELTFNFTAMMHSGEKGVRTLKVMITDPYKNAKTFLYENASTDPAHTQVVNGTGMEVTFAGKDEYDTFKIQFEVQSAVPLPSTTSTTRAPTSAPATLPAGMTTARATLPAGMTTVPHQSGTVPAGATTQSPLISAGTENPRQTTTQGSPQRVGISVAALFLSLFFFF